MSVNKNEIKKVVLAYSGGLDTSIIIPWLKENYNNSGDHRRLRQRWPGRRAGGPGREGPQDRRFQAVSWPIWPTRWCDDVIVPSMKMGAKYEKYLLGTAFARPIIGKKLAEIALAEGADAVVPRLHRQGQRPGPVRAGHQAVCSWHEDHRPLAGVGHQEPGRRD